MVFWPDCCFLLSLTDTHTLTFSHVLIEDLFFSSLMFSWRSCSFVLSVFSYVLMEKLFFCSLSVLHVLMEELFFCSFCSQVFTEELFFCSLHVLMELFFCSLCVLSCSHFSSGQLISDNISEVFTRFDKTFITPYRSTLATKTASAHYDDSYLGTNTREAFVCRYIDEDRQQWLCMCLYYQVTLWQLETSTTMERKVRSVTSQSVCCLIGCNMQQITNMRVNKNKMESHSVSSMNVDV